MPALVLAARSLAMPRQWAQQSQLLERQHDRLGALLDDLIDRHAIADACRSPQQLALDQRDCQLLLRKLGLHLPAEAAQAVADWFASRTKAEPLA